MKIFSSNQPMPNPIASEVSTDQQGRLFIKTFLIDSSVNQNDWGVTQASIRQNIGSFIGKPIVFTDTFDHPSLDDSNLDHVLKSQEPYRVGTIRDVQEKDGRWFAIAEITDPAYRAGVQAANIPPFVSPAIYPTAPVKNEAAIERWTGVHLATVDQPAYGAVKAHITSQCTGSERDCLLQLRNAKLKKAKQQQKDIQDCGFCKAAAIKNYYAKLRLIINSSQKKLPKDNSLFRKSRTARTSKMDSSSSQTDNGRPTANGLAEKYASEHNPHPSTEPDSGPSHPDNTSLDQADATDGDTGTGPEAWQQQKKKKTADAEADADAEGEGGDSDVVPKKQKIAQLEVENARLKQEVAKLRSEAKVAKDLQSRVAKLEGENRRHRIAGIITKDVIRDDKSRTALIDKLTAMNLSEPDFQTIVAPYVASAKDRKTYEAKVRTASTFPYDSMNFESESNGDKQLAFMPGVDV